MIYVHRATAMRCQNHASTADIDHWLVTLTFTSSAAARAAAEARLAAAIAARAFSSTSDEPGPAEDISAVGGWCSWLATLLLVVAYVLELTAGDFGDSGFLCFLVSSACRIVGLSLEMEAAGELSIIGVWLCLTDDPDSSCTHAQNKLSEFLVFRNT
jgi:hypothetical protein